jgi:hypothetical protein
MSSIRCFIKATEKEYEIKGGINGLAGRLYFDLMHSVTQKDWCWYELEMSKFEMIKFLSQEKYKQERHSSIVKHTFPDGSVYEYDLCENAFIEEALDFVNNLSGREDCILVAYDEG